MTSKTIKFSASGMVLVSAIAYLAFAGMQDGWVQYHLAVDAFVKDQQFHRQRVRLAGVVAEEGLVHGNGKLGAQFALTGGGEKVKVSYKGVVPDLFKAGCEVVVEGKLDGNQIFQADLLMTKCASKYESENPHAGKRAESKSKERP